MPTIRKVRTLDLFSGIGGFSLGLQAMARTVAYCEIDESCRRVLRANIDRGLLDDAPIFEDVRKIGSRELTPLKIDMITAGFPCQDISSNNNEGRGLSGSRSSLVWEVLRIAREVPGVQYVLLENSPMIIHKGLPELLRRVQKDGFAWAWGIFAAKDVGAPHERRRWICLLWRSSATKKTPTKFLTPTNLLKKLPKRLPWTPDWTRDLPISMRVLPRNPSLTIRFAHLGNSVVPQVIHLAMKMLTATLISMKSTATPKIQEVECDQESLHDYLRYSLGNSSSRFCIAKADLLELQPDLTDYDQVVERRLVYPSADGPVVKPFWLTPLHKRTEYRRSLASFGGQDHHRRLQSLVTQLLTEQKTLDYIARKANSQRFKAGLSANPQFGEWLMGYPPDWTSLPPEL
jgi:DNA (cytosine-5)-methyltransferase 1